MTIQAALEVTPRQARKSRRRRIIHLIDLTVWMTSAIASVIIAGLVVIYGVQFSRVLSPSMTPEMPVGSVAVTCRVPVDELRVGQVVVLHTPTEGAPYIHRIISMNYRPDGLEVRTKGDANPSPDPWTVTIHRPQVPVLVYVLPLSGVTSLIARLHFMAIPLLFLGVAATAYFGWTAMQRPDDDVRAEESDSDASFNL